MFQSRPVIVSAALALLLGLLAVGPQVVAAAQDDEEVTLRVWDQFTGPESSVVDSIYEGFSEANPNVTIERESFSTDQMRDTINTALSSGTGPDVILYDPGPGYAGVLVEAGLVTPLDALAEQYGWRDRIVPSALQLTTSDGQLQGLPLTTDLIGLYYNKTLLDQEGWTVPETLEQLVAFCGEATEKGYIPIAFGNNPGWQAFHQFSMTANGMVGPEAMRALLFENQGRWDTPEMVTAIQAFFVDLREAGCFNEDPNALTYDDGNSLFYTGQALMTPTGSWLVNDITENMPDQEVAIVPFPQLPGAAGRFWPSGVGSAYYISSQTEHPEEAGQLLDYLVSPEVAQRWVGEAGFFVTAEFDAAAVEVSPLFQSVLDQLRAAAEGRIEIGYNIDVLAPPQFNDAMQSGFQAVLAGDKTPEEQAADLQAAWEEGREAAPATPGA